MCLFGCQMLPIYSAASLSHVCLLLGAKHSVKWVYHSSIAELTNGKCAQNIMGTFALMLGTAEGKLKSCWWFFVGLSLQVKHTITSYFILHWNIWPVVLSKYWYICRQYHIYCISYCLTLLKQLFLIHALFLWLQPKDLARWPPPLLAPCYTSTPTFILLNTLQLAASRLLLLHL